MGRPFDESAHHRNLVTAVSLGKLADRARFCVRPLFAVASPRPAQEKRGGGNGLTKGWLKGVSALAFVGALVASASIAAALPASSPGSQGSSEEQVIVDTVVRLWPMSGRDATPQGHHILLPPGR